MLRATIRTTRGEVIPLSFKNTSMDEVRVRVARAGRKKFPYGFVFTIRGVPNEH
jgi:hypothetical protein